MDRSLHDALIATSAASAILWTGALIVIQLSEGQSNASGTPATTQEPWRYVQFPARPKVDNLRTPKELLSVSSLVMLGFGIIAPILALFLSGIWLRLAAFIFAAIYTKQTLQEAIFGVRVLRGKASLRTDAPDPNAYRKAILWYIALEVAQLLAMIVVLAFPIKMLVLIESVVFLYLGYQGVLGRYLIARRPFEP